MTNMWEGLGPDHTPTAPHSAAGRGDDGPWAGRRSPRLRRLGGLHGQFTYETRKGARTLAFERGTITSVASGDVVVRAQGGTTWVWDLSGRRQSAAPRP